MAHDPTTHDVSVRPLADGEERALARVMRRSFGGLAALLFTTGKAAFVAEVDGRIVGGVTVGAFDVGDGRRGGVVKWVFTLPEARGLGVASLLLDEAMAWFEAQGVTDAFACIEGLNPGSSNRFAERGFEPLGFAAQVRRYGARLPRVWWHANHVADVGHLLWVRRADLGADGAPAGAAPGTAEPTEPPARGYGAFAATLAVHALFGAVMLARLGQGVDLAAVAQLALAVGLVIGVRTSAMAIAGRALGLRLRYRAWETGMTLTGVIALLFGGLFIAPGGLYPRARTWSLRALGPRLAVVSGAGVAAVLVLGWAAYLLAGWSAVAGAAAPVLFYARLLLLFDVLLPFFPMTAFAGRRVWEASRVAWLVARSVPWRSGWCRSSVERVASPLPRPPAACVQRHQRWSRAAR
jgi:L-amino acid N-acyltransferase YncA